MNFYEILGVNEKSSKEDIKKAYRNKAKKHHPDKGGDSKKFNELALAYEILTDEEKREHYDSTGEVKEDKRIEEKVIDYISSKIIPELLSSENIEFDVIGKSIDFIKDEKNKGLNYIKSVEKDIDKLQKIKTKFKNKEGDQNLFELVITSQITSLERKIDKIKNQLEEADEIVKFLENYEYEFEDDSESQMNGELADAFNRILEAHLGNIGGRKIRYGRQ